MRPSSLIDTDFVVVAKFLPVRAGVDRTRDRLGGGVDVLNVMQLLRDAGLDL